MAKEVLAIEKEIGRLRHHVTVLAKKELGYVTWIHVPVAVSRVERWISFV